MAQQFQTQPMYNPVSAGNEPVVATYQPQPAPVVHHVHNPKTNLPYISFVFALVTVLVTVVLCAWIPGLFCLVPALAVSISAMSKAETGQIPAAKKMSYVSFILIIVFYVSFPVLVTIVIIGSVFGSISRYRFYRPYYY